MQNQRLKVFVVLFLFCCVFLATRWHCAKNMPSVVKSMLICKIYDQITHFHAIGHSCCKYRSISICISSIRHITSFMEDAQGFVSSYQAVGPQQVQQWCQSIRLDPRLITQLEEATLGARESRKTAKRPFRSLRLQRSASMSPPPIV